MFQNSFKMHKYGSLEVDCAVTRSDRPDLCSNLAFPYLQYILNLTSESFSYGAPEGTRKLKSFEWLDCTNNKVLNVATAQTIKFRMSRLHKQ